MSGVGRASLPALAGTYVVALRAEHRREISVGRLGSLLVEPGVYLYVGSAFGPGGLRARLGRHIDGTGKPRWHVDLLRAVTRPVAAWWSLAPDRLEHIWAKALAELDGAAEPLPGFGSSDCGCRSHLVRLPTHGREIDETLRGGSGQAVACAAVARGEVATHSRTAVASRVMPRSMRSTVG